MLIESKNLHYSNNVYIKISTPKHGEDVFSDVVKRIISWLYKKWERAAGSSIEKTLSRKFQHLVSSGTSQATDGMKFKTLVSPTAKQWALHLEEEDSIYAEHRVWNTYIAVCSVNDEICALSIEIVNVNSGSGQTRPDPSIPNFLKEIVASGHYVVSSDSKFSSIYSSAYICIKRINDLKALSIIIKSDKRNTPLVVFYGKETEKTAKRFPRAVLAKALVVWIDETCLSPQDVLTCMGNDCDVRGNQLRVFYPSRMTGDDMHLNRWYYPLDNKFKNQEAPLIREILAFSFSEEKSGSYLYSSIRKDNYRARVHRWRENQLTLLLEEQVQSDSTQKTAEDYEKLISEKDKRILELENEVKESKEYISEFESEEKVWQAKEEQYKGKIAVYAKQMLAIDAEREQMSSERADYAHNKDALTYIASCILPQMSAHDILAYYAKRYPNRIYVHPDAYKSADKTSFNEGSEICSILNVLVDEVYDAFVRKTLKVTDIEHRTGYYVAMGEGSQTRNNNRLMAQRRKDYKGTFIDCSHHLKCEKNGKYFRVYFAVINDEHKIIIGHFGDHLETAGTVRRRER